MLVYLSHLVCLSYLLGGLGEHGRGIGFQLSSLCAFFEHHCAGAIEGGNMKREERRTKEGASMLPGFDCAYVTSGVMNGKVRHGYMR